VGEYAIYRQLVHHTWRPDRTSAPQTNIHDMYTVHNPDGTTALALQHHTLHRLHTAFHGTRHKQVHTSMAAASFPHELSALAKRHLHADTFLPDPTLSRIWSTMAEVFRITNDRGPNPLDTIPSATKIWSDHVRDSLFGAITNPCSSLLSGSSRLTVSKTNLSKRIHWASISAAVQPVPVLTLTMVPTSDARRYMNAHHDPFTTTILRIPPNTFEASSGTGRFTNTPAQSQDILITCNAQAWNTHGQHPTQPNLHDILRTALRLNNLQHTRITLAANWSPPPGSEPDTLPSRIRSAMHPNRTPTWCWPPSQQVDTLHFERPPGTSTKPPTAYTDGSHTSQPDRTGSGIWLVNATKHPTGYAIATERPTPVAKVNAAELTAIRWALENTVATTIATDSLVSLYQIAGYLRAPKSFHAHHQRHLLGDIAEALLHRARAGTQTHLTKVKAHTGIPGNEMADYYASLAAQDEMDTIYIPNNWTPPTAWIERHDIPTDKWVPLLDLNKHLGASLPLTTRLGTVKTGVYAASYAAISPYSDPSSHHFLTSGKISWSTRRLALRYRGGGIYNNKHALRYGHATNDRCPLCHQPDGQGHMLGGCQHPDLRKAYTHRHHTAGDTIRTALIKYSRLGTLVQSDVARFPPRHYDTESDSANTADTTDSWDTADSLQSGHPPDTPPAPPLVQPQRIPRQLLPDGENTSKRPDLIFVRDFDPAGESTPSLVHLIEIKYGPDTRLEQKTAPAQLILDAFAASILRRHPHTKVRTWIILLGVGGRIPHSLPAQLREMGLPDTIAKRTCHALNTHAVSCLANIVRARRRLEHNPAPTVQLSAAR
jgi:ribonuclease HI